MRILAMAHAYPPGHNAGAEMTMHVMLRRLIDRGHTVDVVLSRPQAEAWCDYTHDGIDVHVFGNEGTVMPFFRSADVVIAHLENTMRAAALCGIYGKPMVHLIHNTHEFTKGALRRGPAQLAVFNSQWMVRDFVQFWDSTVRGNMPPFISVHPPVDPTPLAGIKHGRNVTLINLNEDKGGVKFWRLAKAMPDVNFLGVKGAYGEQLVPHDQFDNVDVLEHQPPADMPGVYAKTKILLMPSIYESYGRTGIEAAHCGIPTIAHPTPGLLEALGEAGTFVHRDDTAGWQKAIRHLLSPRGFAAASRKAKAHAQSLDPDADLDRFADAMEGVVRRGFAAIAR